MQQILPGLINRGAQTLLAHVIATEIHWVPGHSCIPRNEEADHQVNLVRDSGGNTVIERQYTAAKNRARRICERDQEPRQCGKPTSAASSSATDSRARQGPRDLSRWQERNCWPQVLPTQVWACTHWSLPETVQPSRERQILGVRRRRQDGCPDTGTPFPPLQPV